VTPEMSACANTGRALDVPDYGRGAGERTEDGSGGVSQ
jgi:hypothetical protein